MWSKLAILVILSLTQGSLQDTLNNEIEDDANPFSEAASAILKEQNLQNIGSMVGNFLENGGAQQIGNVLGNLGKDGGGDNMMENIGSIIGGLGGDGNQGGLNPELLGAAINMFAAANSEGNTQKIKKKSNGNDNGFDFSQLLPLAASFMEGQGGSGGNPAESLMNILPTLLQTFNAFAGPDAQRREQGHSGHSSLLPPFLEKLHIYFDHFIHSEMGKTVISFIGAEKIFKIFTDESGRFDYNKFGEMMENHSFRRHWIKQATDRVMTLLKMAADPQLSRQYLAAGPFFVNSYLHSNGFPKSVNLDLNKPTESISNIANHIAKKYIGVKISSKQYVKPVVVYVQDLFKQTQTPGFIKDHKKVSDAVADTINLEIIEPIARVNRAYRFSKKTPVCDKYVFCLVNEHNPNEASLPELKKMLYKGSSLVASWFVSGESNTPFWSLYEVVTGSNRCKDYYSEKCEDFHVEEIKVTTEYVHNEL
ncbi:unnamed protein product [Brassicogethes aeneus]|uniref:Uncharacterized protein n=1 Tax=Brassicogethes aeneus TaxID=1431903 RepID=A0A9P0B2W4_BRAAE|nr:unnamed protein product [Brassicogethes aeneus]